MERIARRFTQIVPSHLCEFIDVIPRRPRVFHVARCDFVIEAHRHFGFAARRVAFRRPEVTSAAYFTSEHKSHDEQDQKHR